MAVVLTASPDTAEDVTKAVLLRVNRSIADYSPSGRFVAITTLLGAGSAAGSLAIARLADDRQLLATGIETADVGLSPNEKRELLGDPD